MTYPKEIEIYNTDLLLVEDETGNRFAITKHVGAELEGLTFAVVTVYERDGKEIPAIIVESFKVIQTISSQ